jgi:hypothetical protein
VKKIPFVIAFLLLSLATNAQPGDDPAPDPGNPVPLHGIGWLLAAGGAYGARKLLKTRKSHPGDHR